MSHELAETCQTESIAQMLDCLPVGVCLIDEDHCLRHWNGTLEKWTGQPRGEVEGHSLLELFPDLNQPWLRDHVETVFATGQSVELLAEEARHFIPARSSETNHLMAQRTTLSFHAGPPAMIMIVIEELPEAANSAHRIGAEFIGGMTYELRKPLDTIFGYTDFLREHETAPERRAAFDGIGRNCERMLTVMSDVLDFAKIESGQLRIERNRFQLQPLLKDIVSLIGLNAMENGIEFRREFAAGVPEWIETDPIRLRQILLNLLSNAVIFTEAGYVKLTAEVVHTPLGKRLRFNCIDTGVGISSERLAQLFQPFREIDADLSPRKKGTGLGLAISHRLAELLGGELTVTSEAGVGSTFSLTIPF